MSGQQSERHLIRLSVIKGVQRFHEDRFIGGSLHAQGQAGVESHVVRTAKDGVWRALRVKQYQLHALFDSRPQDGMTQVLPGFFNVSNAVMDGGVAASQGFVLREHKPHPVGDFLSCFQFGHGLVKADVLSSDKAL